MGRRNTRELAMKLLFQFELQKEGKEEQIEQTLSENDLSDREREYLLNVVNGVCLNIKEIDDTILKNAVGWKIERMSKVDISVLRLAIYEMFYIKDIPDSVSINEAIEVAKKYSVEESGSFVNGILGKISKQREPQNDRNTKSTKKNHNTKFIKKTENTKNIKEE